MNSKNAPYVAKQPMNVKKTQTYHKPIKIISDWKSFPNTQVSDLLDIDNTISM